MIQPCFTIPQLHEMLNISKADLRRWWKDGDLVETDFKGAKSKIPIFTVEDVKACHLARESRRKAKEEEERRNSSKKAVERHARRSALRRDHDKVNIQQAITNIFNQGRSSAHRG